MMAIIFYVNSLGIVDVPTNHGSFYAITVRGSYLKVEEICSGTVEGTAFAGIVKGLTPDFVFDLCSFVTNFSDKDSHRRPLFGALAWAVNSARSGRDFLPPPYRFNLFRRGHPRCPGTYCQRPHSLSW